MCFDELNLKIGNFCVFVLCPYLLKWSEDDDKKMAVKDPFTLDKFFPEIVMALRNCPECNNPETRKNPKH